ncbi:helix-turn-helix domain-containing protein [Paenarthrobacter ureafaciens]|uniref:helix-turn-helix domain-containing protein n=1 Tax=Paenarthrobacter ureafaciens TaxID=37931 RepID=UPI003CE8B8DF
MTLNRSSKNIGKRLARYRKLAGMTAQQLSDALGGELSRSVIANIESGRKSDLTVDQLFALAWVLGVPPVVLALPVEDPYAEVLLVEGEPGVVLPSHAAVSWMTFSRNAADVMEEYGPDVDENEDSGLSTQAGYAAAQAMITYAIRLSEATSAFQTAAYYAEGDPEWKADYMESKRKLEALHKEMRRSGMQVPSRVPKVVVEHGDD